MAEQTGILGFINRPDVQIFARGLGEILSARGGGRAPDLNKVYSGYMQQMQAEKAMAAQEAMREQLFGQQGVGILSGMTPQQRQMLQHMYQMDPSSAMGIIGQQLFPQGMSPADRYRVVDGGLVDLAADGGPSYVPGIERDAPDPTSLERRAAAAGLQPGTPEYQRFMLQGGAKEPKGPDVKIVKQPDGSFVAVTVGPDGAASSAPVAGPAGEAKPEPGYRMLSPDEARTMGLPEGQSYQVGPDGRVAPIKGPSGGITIGPDGSVQIGGPLREFEAKAGQFALRMNEADKRLTPTEDALLAQGGASLADKAFSEWGSIGNFFTSDEYQAYRAAAQEWIGALLRLDSGAAVPESEFQRYFQTYFVQPGDTPEVARQKREARATAMSGVNAVAPKSITGAAPSPAPEPTPEPTPTPTPTPTPAGDPRFEGMTDDEILKLYGAFQ